MRLFAAAACVALLAAPATGRAQSLTPPAPLAVPTTVQTVGDLATVCSPPASAAPVLRLEAIAYCQGFLTAAGQYHAAMSRVGGSSRPIFCLPSPPPSVAQTGLDFSAWAAQNPQRGAEPALEGLLRFAQATYPCLPPSAGTPRQSSR